MVSIKKAWDDLNQSRQHVLVPLRMSDASELVLSVYEEVLESVGVATNRYKDVWLLLPHDISMSYVKTDGDDYKYQVHFVLAYRMSNPSPVKWSVGIRASGGRLMSVWDDAVCDITSDAREWAVDAMRQTVVQFLDYVKNEYASLDV